MRIVLTILSLLLFVSCSDSTRFALLDSRKTGISFKNIIVETDSFNVMKYEYIYNGAGTGIGDLNNDGLPDIVFAGNQVKPGVYLNEGKLRFRDITTSLGEIPEQWYSSVSLADVNCDGWLDIFMTSTHEYSPEKSKDRLWINNGVRNAQYSGIYRNGGEIRNS